MAPKEPPRKPEKPERPKREPSKKDMAYWTNFFPVNGCDPYYRNCNGPIDLMLRVMNDERKHLSIRYQAALDVAPYLASKPSPRPYAPTEEERRQLEESKRLIIEIVDFSEVDPED
jgi:hypothetical protein